MVPGAPASASQPAHLSQPEQSARPASPVTSAIPMYPDAAGVAPAAFTDQQILHGTGFGGSPDADVVFVAEALPAGL